MAHRYRFLLRVRWRIQALPGALVTRDWIIAVAFTVGMASLSAAFGIVPDLAVEGWTGNPRLPWMFGAGVTAVVTLGAGIAMWWHRNALLHRRGTAYLIEEVAPGWDAEDKRAFTAAVRSQFAAVREVPGPGRLRSERAWIFDDRGGRLWDQHLTDLVHSFLAVHANDDPTTENALYLWAPWSVALAFGLRTVDRHRGLRLHVRHRPSYGRLGETRPAGFARPGLTFRDAETLSGVVVTGKRRIRLRAAPAGNVKSVTLLLIRTSDLPYGSLPATTGRRLPTVAVRDAARLGLPRRATVTMQEWTYRPPHRLVAWSEYQAVAAAAAEWIRERAAAAGEDGTILLGALVPQEIGVGIGIVAASMPDWPAHLWPLMYDAENDRLVTVELNLGRAVDRDESRS